MGGDASFAPQANLVALKPGIHRVIASVEGCLSACTVLFPFEIIINVLVSSFEYLCYGSMAI